MNPPASPPSATASPSPRSAPPRGGSPSLSVIVPNFNHAKYLPASLTSILRQSFQPTEVLVLDDASTDNSVDVIREFERQNPLIRLIRNEKNLGVMPNLNKGVGLARGDYVYIGSADDEVLPGLFEKSMRLLAQHPQAGFSATVSRWCYVESGLTWYMGAGMADRPTYLSPDDLVQLGRQGKLLINGSSAVFRKNALRDVGLFVPELRWHADWFACFTCAFRYGFCYIPEPLSLVNILPKSFYTSGTRRPEHREVLRHIVEHLQSPPYADVAPRVRDSGALSLFAGPMLKILWSRREYRRFINWTLLRRTARRSAELAGRNLLPRWLARWILTQFYRLPAA